MAGPKRKVAAKVFRGAETIESWPIDRLQPYGRNSRTHGDEQVAKVAASIERFGFTNPILAAEDGTIIAGHGRLLAARSLGMTEVPVIVAGGWSDDERRAYVIADNQLALEAGWDEEILKLELSELRDAGFDLALTGFGAADLAGFLDVTEGATDPEDTPEPPVDPVAIGGDLWALGRHRLLCGDSVDIEQVRRVTGGIVPDIANCDPPYGISIVKGSTVGGAKAFGSIGGHQHRPGNELRRGRVHGNARRAIIKPNVYAPIIGDDTTETAIRSHGILTELGVPVIALWGGNYFANALPPSRCWLVWDKENSGSFADAELAWTNQDAVVRLLRHQWSGLIKASERGERRVHPTQKPVALSEWVIETLAPNAKTAIDLFMGGGAMLIACERKGIDCFGVEMAEAYCDVVIQRWQNFTGEKATLVDSGLTFEQVAKKRKKAAGIDAATAAGLPVERRTLKSAGASGNAGRS